MIPELFINEWKQHAPWVSDHQVEQDLILSRAIVEIYSLEEIREKLAFRGGTALHKLHLKAPARYSEDLDFIQIDAEPIGKTMDLIRSKLDSWLGEPKRQAGKDLVKMVYRYQSENNIPMRIKIEINAREHFAAPHVIQLPFRFDSQWFQGQAEVTTLRLDWLMGSKLRALHQRRKSRDLYDLYLMLQEKQAKPQDVIKSFEEHMEAQSLTVSRAEFEKNLHQKLKDKIFLDDLPPLLTADQDWDIEKGHERVNQELIGKLSGDPWKGPKKRSKKGKS